MTAAMRKAAAILFSALQATILLALQIFLLPVDASDAGNFSDDSERSDEDGAGGEVHARVRVRHTHTPPACHLMHHAPKKRSEAGRRERHAPGRPEMSCCTIRAAAAT